MEFERGSVLLFILFIHCVMFGPRLRWDKVQDMEIFIFIFKYIPILSDFFSFFLTISEKCFFFKYLSRLGLVGCIQSSLFWINFWCWRGLVRSVVMRRRGAVNDRQALKVPRLETTPVRGPAWSGLSVMNWSSDHKQPETPTTTSAPATTHHTPHTTHSTLNTQYESLWKSVSEWGGNQ